MNNNTLPLSSAAHAGGLIVAAAAAAATAAIGLPLLQSDYVSRAFLSAQQVHQKRQTEYQYRWSFLLEKIILHTLDRLGGDSYLELLVNDDEINAFIDKCLNVDASAEGEKKAGPRVVALGIDENLSSRPTCVWIEFQRVVHQIVLKDFVRLLYPRLQVQLTTTAMCFVAEATAGRGPHIIESILQEVPLLNVPVVRQPQWMAMLAHLFQNQSDASLSTTVLEQTLFALTRLEANTFVQDKKIKTVCFTLPGQAVSAVLMPHLFSVFPCERHVFLYDSCASVVNRAAAATKPKQVVGPGFALEHPYKHSTPMRSSSTSTSKSFVSRISNGLSKLPLSLADTTETWITTVDAFLALKETEKTKNMETEYLPFVCKLDLLLQERPLALQNVLQFMTGARSRSLPEGALEQALVVLDRLYEASAPKSLPQKQQLSFLSPKLYKAIEDCVFQHKGILIGHKTLIDTVLPQVEWTLKAAKKISGCACCAPDPFDDEEEEKDDVVADLKGEEEVNNSSFTVKAKKRERPAFVDGKLGFAFDPTRF